MRLGRGPEEVPQPWEPWKESSFVAVAVNGCLELRAIKGVLGTQRPAEQTLTDADSGVLDRTQSPCEPLPWAPPTVPQWVSPGPWGGLAVTRSSPEVRTTE